MSPGRRARRASNPVHDSAGAREVFLTPRKVRIESAAKHWGDAAGRKGFPVAGRLDCEREVKSLVEGGPPSHGRRDVAPAGSPGRPWILLNPGPACTTPAVKQALLTPDLCHREPEFFQVLRWVRERLTYLAGGDPGWSTVLFTGSGTAAVEAAICSAVPADGGVLVVDNGVYGDRMRAIAAAHGLRHRVLQYGWTTPATPEDAERLLTEEPHLTHLAVVHHETTTGLMNPIQALGDVCRRSGRSLIVDAMSSFGGEELDVARMGIDYMASSANKCLQGMPGISFVVAREELLRELAGRQPRSVYLDLYNQWCQEEADNTPFTPAIQVLFALRQAILETEEEGLPSRLERYAASAAELRAAAARLGLEPLVPEPHRSRTLTTFALPPGVGYGALHDAMKRRGYVIYAGQGSLRDWAFRIANLGTLAPRDMIGVAAALAVSIEEVRSDK